MMKLLSGAMNIPHEIGHILPTNKNVQAMLDFTREDLRRSEVSEADILTIADSDNPAHIDRQRKKLLKHPQRYLGAVAGQQLFGGVLEGFVKFNTWRAADELPFETEAGREALERRIANERHNLPSMPLGIFALHVTSQYPEETQHEIGNALLDAALYKHATTEVRVGLHANDPLLPVFKRRGFKPQSRFGNPLSDDFEYHQELFIRPGVK